MKIKQFQAFEKWEESIFSYLIRTIGKEEGISTKTMCISKEIDGSLQHPWEKKFWYIFISLYEN